MATSNQGQETRQPAARQGRGGAMGSTYLPSPAEFFTNPFGVMRRMHEDMDRVFAQALGGGLMSGGESHGGGGGMTGWSPVIEVRQQDNNLIVCAELPGLKPDEVQVEVNEDALVIQGERRNEHTSEEGGIHRSERRYGHFYRAIPLPEGVNAEEAKATFNHGVLEITVPMPQQQSKRRQIPISGGSAETPSAGTGNPDRPSNIG